MRVNVDYELCESNAICMDTEPAVFQVADDDLLYVLQEQPAEDYRSTVEEAARNCPRQAITIQE